jgi:predicted HNH restriction endonuclease
MLSTIQYQKAITRLSKRRQQILITHLVNGPFVDTTEISIVLGYPNINSTNLQLGSIGKKLAEETGVMPEDTYLYKDEARPSYYLLIHSGNKEGHWQLNANLALAIKNLGWIADHNVAEEFTSLGTEVTHPTENLFMEGKLVRVFVNRYERNPALRMKCLEYYNSKCVGCDEDFSKKYGKILLTSFMFIT